MASKNKSDSNELGTIRDDTTYPLEVFQRTAGLGKHAFAQLRRNGLPVRRVGNRAFILGRDFSAFLSRQIEERTSDESSDDSSKG